LEVIGGSEYHGGVQGRNILIGSGIMRSFDGGVGIGAALGKPQDGRYGQQYS
jgi:hypothetical protein